MAGEESPELYRFPEFFDRLRTKGVMRTRDVIESEHENDGLVYHHRGLQVPATSVTFTLEDESTFAVHVDGLGGRTVRVWFDLELAWDIYLILDPERPVVTWMSDEEYEAEEVDTFPSKSAAVQAGRFSYGTFVFHGDSWDGRRTWAANSTAPAILQLGDGRILDPVDEAAYRNANAAIPSEARSDNPSPAPEYLGVREMHVERVDD